MPLYQFTCMHCEKSDVRILRYTEFDEYKAGKNPQQCGHCGNPMALEIDAKGLKVMASTNQIFLPALCNSCIRLPKCRAPFEAGGCSSGKKCRGYMPKSKKDIKRISRTQYKQQQMQAKMKGQLPGIRRKGFGGPGV